MAIILMKERPLRERYVGTRRHYYHPFAFTGFLLATAGLVLLAIATGTYFLYKNGNADLGMFKACSNDGSDCSNTINSNCDINGGGLLSNNFGGTLPSCSMFNAVRALAIISVILAGLAVLMMLCTCCSRYVFYEYVSGICFLSAICGLVSFFVALGYKEKEFSGVSYGYSFWLLLAGWICELIASCTYAGWGRSVYA